MSPADPPPNPTLNDNRLIHEAIEANWNAERGLYVKSVSDKVLADGLHKPRAWVTAVREGFFGPADACEARVDAAASLGGLEARAKGLEDRAMTLAADAETLRRDVAAARKAVGV